MKLITALILILTMCNTYASPIDKPQDGVKYRQSAYFLLRMNTGPLAKMVMKKAEFDADKFRYYAERAALIAQFPKDGFAEKWLTADSEAKPEIWENKADFDKKMQLLIDATQSMADISKTGSKEDMFNAFKTMAKACKACHKKYRMDDD